MKNEPSEHFAVLKGWIVKAIKTAIAECEDDFAKQCSVQERPRKEFLAAVENSYREYRSFLKKECYGTRSDEGLLDARKIAAVVCKALIKEKPISFDEEIALSQLIQKRASLKKDNNDSESNEELNYWIVNNYFINYKVAFLASIMIVYNVLLEELAHEGKNVETAKKLGLLGELYKYPDSKGFDSFQVNVVIGLGRADMIGRELDTFLFAMLLYQMEMYTLLALKEEN